MTIQHQVLIRGRGGLKLMAAGLTLLCLLLPALVAGAGIDQPVTASERARVQQAIDPQPVAGRSLAADVFYTATLPEQRQGPDGTVTVSDMDLRLARFSALSGILMMTGLLYLLMTVARGRFTALLSCAALAALPPVYADGVLLVPENPATAFGLLGVLLLASATLFMQPGKGRPQYGGVLGFSLLSGLSIGLAAGCLPRAAIHLLQPLTLLMLGLLLVWLRLPRLLRRRSIYELPMRGVNRRIIPFGLIVFGVLCGAFFVQSVMIEGDAEALLPSEVRSPLFPDSLWAKIPLVVLSALGFLWLLLSVGYRLSRSRQVGPGLVVVLFVALLLLQHMLADGELLRLPAVPALAILLAEGSQLLIRLLAGLAVRQGH